MSLRKRAIAAWEQQKTEEEEARREREAQDLRQGLTAINRWLKREDPAKALAFAFPDGWRFHRMEHRTALQVKGVCPACGEPCWSTPIWGLAGLGKALVEFTPDYYHHCPSRAKQETAEERLVSALREFVLDLDD